MNSKSYFYSAIAILLMITNVAFSMQQEPESETADIFTVGTLKEDYEELRTLPEQRRQTFFPHLPNHEIIQWFHVLGVDKNATQSEILAAIESLMTRFSPIDQYPREVYAVIKAQADALNISEFKVAFKTQDHLLPGLYEVHEASLEDILLPEDKEKLAKMQCLMGTWKRFYMFKFGFLSLMFLGPKLCDYLQESEYESIKESEWFKKMADASKYVQGATDSWLGKACLFGAFGVYPLIKFWNLTGFMYNYRYHSIDFREGLRVFFQKKFSHSVRDRYDPIRRTEYRTNFYNVSYPTGYMWDKDIRKKFMPIRKANVMKVLTWVSSALLGGFLLVL